MISTSYLSPGASFTTALELSSTESTERQTDAHSAGPNYALEESFPTHPSLSEVIGQ